MQPQGHVQVLANMIDFGMDAQVGPPLLCVYSGCIHCFVCAQAALDASRFCLADDGTVNIEDGE